ncbi:hypothetical protein EST38_g9955 [Candolleomyces aberdarensis]|uniref:Uncharacterized protein n=1 Tax=Candolleomyces aberdarensis TaxID=2316362 RepID=A0A4Q2D9B6_9AGAR|nr:hypothetical protein EST38_g9955 [Candolleomyces aberdarensis]
MTEAQPDRLVLSSDLVVEDRAVYNVHNSRSITAFKLSADASILTRGQVRDMSQNGFRFIAFHAGENIPIACLLWHPSVTTEQRALFIASANGFIHCVTFSVDTDNPVCTNPTVHIQIPTQFLVVDQKPFNTAVRVPGLITCMAINHSATELAASHDNFTKVWKLPFRAGEPEGPEAASVVPHEVLAGRDWQNIPVRNHPRPVGLQYAPDGALFIAFFSKIEVYNTSNLSKSWEIIVPEDTQIGSFTLSPSGRLIAATNLVSGVEWFSAVTKSHLSTTRIDDEYNHRSYMLPIEFLSDTTFAIGHNAGKVISGCHGVDATEVLAQHETNLPCRFLSVTKSLGVIPISVNMASPLDMNVIDSHRDIEIAETQPQAQADLEAYH